MLSPNFLLFFSLSGIFLFLVSLWYQKSVHFSSSVRFMAKQSILVCLLTLVLVVRELSLFYWSSEVKNYVISDLILISADSLIFTGLILFVAVAILVASLFYINRFGPFPSEVIFLFLLTVFGSIILVSSCDFITFYLGLELQTLPLYAILVITKRSEASTEAALRYFILSLFASASLLFGFSLIYYASGLTNFNELVIFFKLSAQAGLLTPTVANLQYILSLYIALILVIFSLMFKIGAAPLYFWVPDIYAGSPVLVVFIFALIPKTAVLYGLFNLLVYVFSVFYWFWFYLVLFCAITSILVGIFGAMRATTIARFLAFGGISHIGFMLTCFFAPSATYGFGCLFFYLLSYVFASVIFFYIWLVPSIPSTSQYPSTIKYLTEFTGLLLHSPLYSCYFSLALFSFTGLPPLFGFFAKFFILKLLVLAHLPVLSILLFVFSAASAVYYLRVVRLVFFNRAFSPNTLLLPTTRFPLLFHFVLFFAAVALFSFFILFYFFY